MRSMTPIARGLAGESMVRDKAEEEGARWRTNEKWRGRRSGSLPPSPYAYPPVYGTVRSARHTRIVFLTSPTHNADQQRRKAERREKSQKRVSDRDRVLICSTLLLLLCFFPLLLPSFRSTSAVYIINMAMKLLQSHARVCAQLEESSSVD